MVFIIEVDNKGIDTFKEMYFKNTIRGISDFRFSKKEPTAEGLALSETSSYINKIYTVGHLNGSLQGISYDYQLHFYPLQEDVRENIKSFLSDSLKGFQNDIINA